MPIALALAAPSPESPSVIAPCPRLLRHTQRATAAPLERPTTRRSAVSCGLARHGRR
jgi:hypothetical protein